MKTDLIDCRDLSSQAMYKFFGDIFKADTNGFHFILRGYWPSQELQAAGIDGERG
jgi:hypothetical protein